MKTKNENKGKADPYSADRLDQFMWDLWQLDKKIGKQEQVFERAAAKFEEEYWKTHGDNITNLEKQQKEIEKEFGIKREDIVLCEGCHRFYHKTQLKKWLWTGSDPEDAEEITNCPKNHQIFDR